MNTFTLAEVLAPVLGRKSVTLGLHAARTWKGVQTLELEPEQPSAAPNDGPKPDENWTLCYTTVDAETVREPAGDGTIPQMAHAQAPRTPGVSGPSFPNGAEMLYPLVDEPRSQS
jgi:hypothetical protein